MIVEDEALIAFDLEMTFEDAGFDVYGPFYSLHEAMEADITDVDIAVLDVQLGKHTVFPFADKLTEHDVPFVFHSGHLDRFEAEKSYPGCMLAPKPAPPDKMIRVTRELLEATGSGRGAR